MRQSYNLVKTTNGWKLTGKINLCQLWENEQQTVTDIGIWAERTLILQGFLRDDDEELNSINLDEMLELCDEHNVWPFAWNPRVPIGFTKNADPRMLEEEKDVVLWMLSNLEMLKYAPWIPTMARAETLNDAFFNKCLIGELEEYKPASLRPYEPQTVPHYTEHLWGEKASNSNLFEFPKIWHEEFYGAPWNAWDGPEEDDGELAAYLAQRDAEARNFILEEPMQKIGCHHFHARRNETMWHCTATKCRFAEVDPPLPSWCETPPPRCDCRYLPSGLKENYKTHDPDCRYYTE